MSQFDFPRINFFGQAYINPPTANNNALLPLLIFDPINVKAIIPPRIYVSKSIKYFFETNSLSLPPETLIHKDENGLEYLEIKTINSPRVFKHWATTPLGQFALDEVYHPVYEHIRTVRDNLPLKGLLPANWNYYGGMDFGLENVQVISVEIEEGSSKTKRYTDQDKDCPPDIKQFLNASIDFKNPEGKNTAVMVDVIPSLAFYTQVFSDSFTIKKEEKLILKGKPSKASLRFLNPNRIVNQENAVAGSGIFFCVIPLSDLEDAENALIMSFFSNYHQRKAKILGVFIRYTLFEVQENNYPDYEQLGTRTNQARCSILGNITPWYETDMKSVTMGRQMVPVNPYFQNKKLPPFVCCFDENRKVLRLDLINSIPEIVTYTDLGHKYNTYNLGEIKLKIKTKADQEIAIGSLDVNDNALSRQNFIQSGGIFEFSYAGKGNLNQKIILGGTLLMYGTLKQDLNAEATETLLMQECEYMVASDQAGIYLDQFKSPEKGYNSYSNTKESCRVQIYHKGRLLKGNIPMTIMELKINSSGSSASVNKFFQTAEFQDNQELHFPSQEAANMIYVLYPGNSYQGSKYLIPDILNTGFFINLRILPKHDYGRYLDPNHPLYPTPISFNLLYEEILKVYDLIYPSSSIITPFTEEYFKLGWNFIKNRSSPENWNSYSYMPSSRDLSLDQWQLLCKWADDVKNR